jgi:hypothetical protein
VKAKKKAFRRSKKGTEGSTNPLLTPQQTHRVLRVLVKTEENYDGIVYLFGSRHNNAVKYFFYFQNSNIVFS